MTRDEKRAYNRRYFATHREKYRAAQVRYREAHIVEIRARQREKYRLRGADPELRELRRLYVVARRARISAAIPPQRCNGCGTILPSRHRRYCSACWGERWRCIHRAAAYRWFRRHPFVSIGSEATRQALGRSVRVRLEHAVVLGPVGTMFKEVANG